MRRSQLAFVICSVTGLVAAQPPVPLDPTTTGFGGAVVSTADREPPRVDPDLASKTTQVTRLEAELAGLREREVETGSNLRARARSLYRIRRSAPLPREGGIDALLSRRGRLERLEQVILDDARRLADYRRRIRATETSLTAARNEANEAMRRHELEDAARRAIEEQFGGADPAYGSLPRLPVAPIPDEPVVAIGAGSAPIEIVSNGGFAALRGRLGMPITNAIGMRDAVRDDGPGIEFVARAGTAVMSVAAGRVAFAGDYGSYGRMIILDHGDTFYTIYAGLGRIAARVGDWVERGGLLAEVGGSASGNPALFFEVRRGTRSLDTRSWIGVAR